ncbi:MAG: hypothetical protein QOD70_1266 [Frankiales bacterium]|nr:hypothetical protein [Frankiales bacterium]
MAAPIDDEQPKLFTDCYRDPHPGLGSVTLSTMR